MECRVLVWSSALVRNNRAVAAKTTKSINLFPLFPLAKYQKLDLFQFVLNYLAIIGD